MNIVIIEDEVLAANKLEQLVLQYNPNFKILAKIRSVKEAIAWFTNQGLPDLLFMDIHLLDGNSFDILKKIEINCLVVFTTAHNRYALDAFKVNSIDYLLKPINYDKLEKAFQKLEQLQKKLNGQSSDQLQQLMASLSQQNTTYKDRFLVKSGTKMFSVDVGDISQFYSEERISFLHTRQQKRFMISQSLEELESILDPKDFFRINRQMIVHINSIIVVHKHFKGRLKIELNTVSPFKEIMVSSRRASDFQTWLDR
ncbi:MAG: DNA-binding response regulator [Flavobacteriaceae bacterium]|nr:MAG: DNA-binding response regulator [Flavobacteriaceae bacterium]